MSRQLLQVGEPAQRTGFSAPLWFKSIFLTTEAQRALRKGKRFYESATVRGCLKSRKVYYKPLSKPLPEAERGFETPIPS